MVRDSDEAEDLTQEAFLRGIALPPTYPWTIRFRPIPDNEERRLLMKVLTIYAHSDPQSFRATPRDPYLARALELGRDFAHGCEGPVSSAAPGADWRTDPCPSL
jgi:hypothetical protein